MCFLCIIGPYRQPRSIASRFSRKYGWTCVGNQTVEDDCIDRLVNEGTSKRPCTGRGIDGDDKAYIRTVPAVPSTACTQPWAAQAMCPGGMFEPGWHIGAFFKCILRPGSVPRVYDGPPDGTVRVNLGPKEINIDFSKPYKIRALFCNHTFSAVQFKAPAFLTMKGFMKPAMLVWTNVRRYTDWWASLVDASAAVDFPDCFSEVEDTEGGSPIMRDARVPAAADGPALTAPNWQQLDHDRERLRVVFGATGIRICNADI